MTDLLWLGRYVERSYTTLHFVLSAYDAALDSVEGNWKGQLEELGFNQETDDPEQFFRDCLFSAELPASIAYSLNAAYDNAVVLRDVIGSESAAYVQMALNDSQAAAASDTPLLDLQAGNRLHHGLQGQRATTTSTDDAARNIIKCGISRGAAWICTRASGYRLGRPAAARRTSWPAASTAPACRTTAMRTSKQLIGRRVRPQLPRRT